MRERSMLSESIEVCRHACRHADCCMERGDELPLGITAYWPDGTLYVPTAGPITADARVLVADPADPGDAGR